jgi:lipoyl(octanoyl) transferase
MPAPAARPGAGIPLEVRRRGRLPYRAAWGEMQDCTAARGPGSPDEIWLLEHPPVYTQGRAGRPEHVLDPGPIPVIPTDRGGQVTYHGPGQLVAYVLWDLPRLGIGVKRFVALLEQAVLDLLGEAGIAGERRAGAPGVYVGGAKICALGLRVRRGCTYHGLALNVAPDLAPFGRINPCGYRGLAVTSLRALGVGWGLEEAGERLLAHLEAAHAGLQG